MSHIDRIGRAARPGGMFRYDRGHHLRGAHRYDTAGTSGGTEASSDALAAVAAFQEDIQALSDAISESDSAEELRSAWDTLNAELTESVGRFARTGHRPGGDRGEFG